MVLSPLTEHSLTCAFKAMSGEANRQLEKHDISSNRAPVSNLRRAMVLAAEASKGSVVNMGDSIKEYGSTKLPILHGLALFL